MVPRVSSSSIARLFPALLLALSPGAALATGPSPAQVHDALARAERSPQLWATVNICDTRRDMIGIRGQMPALGFTAGLYMTVTVDYWRGNRPARVRGAKKTIHVGTPAKGLYQAGADFRFRPHAGLLSGTITFGWRRAGKLLGSATRRTTRGHHNVHFSKPPRYSVARCAIP
jgi:hypothetical protein